MNTISFTKMHGLGNDFVVVDCVSDNAPGRMIDAAMAAAMCDRRTGIGADGVLLIEPGDVADFQMRVLNADGSEPEMCGNGIRCVCKCAVERGICTARPMRVATGCGVLELDYELDAQQQVVSVTVDMGEALWGPDAVAADAKHLEVVGESQARIDVNGKPVDAVLVSMGNPHVVVFVDDVTAIDLERFGPAVERHAAFANRTNVHVVQVHSSDEVTMQTWERGCGITQACGTGACAVCVAGVLTERTAEAITAHLPGGDLALRFARDSGHVSMTGPAVSVYEGVWNGVAINDPASSVCSEAAPV